MLKDSYFHGSTSASLPGVFDSEKPGLVPAGILIENGGVPYCGELHMAFVEGGANKDKVSVVPGFEFRGAVSYAFRDEGWDPKKGISELEKHERTLKNWAGKEVSQSQQKFQVDPLKALIDLEKRRLEKWCDLKRVDRKIIREPFPVIYGLNTNNEMSPINSDYGLEMGVHGKVELAEIHLYVPNSRVKFVTRYIKRRGLEAAVSEFEKLAPLADCSVNNEHAFEWLVRDAN